MPKLIIYFIFLFIYNYASGQKKKPKETYYVYDHNWKPTEIDNAKYLSYVLSLDDTTHEWNNYNFKGPLINIETYKDEAAQTPHGYFAWFDEQGKIDSSGHVFEKKKHGKWYYFSDSLSVSIVDEYEMGILLKHTDYRDSVIKKGSETLLPGEREATFKGGDKGWRTYLEKNFKTPARAENFHISGMTITLFTIDTVGRITDLKLQKSVEFSIDREALRLIGEGPKWIPAEQAGRKVRAYRKQPITFSN